jgi:uncharacterized membrane protein
MVLFLIYALFAHWSVLRGDPWLELVSLSALTAGMAYPALRAGRPGAWLALIGLAGGLALLNAAGRSGDVVYLPSVALPLAALYGFARTLLPGQTALVTGIAAAGFGGPLPAVLVAYTRAVTWMWTLVIAAVLAVDLYLIVAAPREAWSEFANLYIYLILAAVFLGEYVYRRWRYRRFDQPGFIDYLRLLARQRPGLA